jgi:hypothetical protein
MRRMPPTPGRGIGRAAACRSPTLRQRSQVARCERCFMKSGQAIVSAIIVGGLLLVRLFMSDMLDVRIRSETVAGAALAVLIAVLVFANCRRLTTGQWFREWR